MRVPRSMFVACAVASVVGACTSTTPPVDTGADAAAIRQVVARYQGALNSGDLDAAVAMYAADAVFMPNEAPPQNGLATIRTYYQQTTLANRFEAVFTPTDVQVSGDIAWAAATITGKQTPPSGNTYSFDSKALFVLRRTPAGEWKVMRYIFNANAPLPPPTR